MTNAMMVQFFNQFATKTGFIRSISGTIYGGTALSAICGMSMRHDMMSYTNSSTHKRRTASTSHSSGPSQVFGTWRS